MKLRGDFLERYYLSTWYTVFSRFSYIPDIFTEMKRNILELFPNYKKNPYIMEREDPLFDLLEMIPEPRPEELMTVREAYLSVY